VNASERSDALVFFGASGDLAYKKIFPALYAMARRGKLDVNIVGVARSGWTRDQLVERARASVSAHGEPDDAAFAILAAALRYVDGDYNDASTFNKLKQELADSKRPAHYLAIPPSMFAVVVKHLADAGLTANARIIVEKPFGRDLKSARELNDTLHQFVPERQIFRIDHYLGKEAVQNLLALRFANALFEPLWNSTAIDHVQITVAETVGVEGRWGYYDDAGALRDMVQNHMLQLVALVAMEPPHLFEPGEVRNEKTKVLRSLRGISPATAAANTVRGQYTAGSAGGKAVPGYNEEQGALSSKNGGSDTETFVALRAEIDNWRWAGVPFYLRTGKRMQSRRTDIAIQFKTVPHNIFAASEPNLPANKLVIHLQPQESVTLEILSKQPGLEGVRLREVPLELSLPKEESGGRTRIAYERLLLDAFKGNSTLFVRRDEVEAAWSWIDGIQSSWRSTRQLVKPYPAGTWGPTAAIALTERHGHSWYE
jgi:glucose-6-phosphate 1-dehydrogenase